jgi:hypothetical protein
LRDAVTAAGLVDDEQWDAAWNDALTGVPLSTALAVQASADEAELERLVEGRIVDAVFELLVTTASDFEFRGAEVHPLAGGRRHEVDALIEASRARLERWREVATVLPSTMRVWMIDVDDR